MLVTGRDLDEVPFLMASNQWLSFIQLKCNPKVAFT